MRSSSRVKLKNTSQDLEESNRTMSEYMYTETMSPCIGACEIDEKSGFCKGCARTRDEIANWRTQDDFYRYTVWSRLPYRSRQLGITRRRLPWDQRQIYSFILESVKNKSGVWAMGTVGADAEFIPAAQNNSFVARDGNEIKAEINGARLRFNVDENVRALACRAANSKEQERIVLAAKRKEGGLISNKVITCLGKDHGAIDRGARGHYLFDLGLGREDVRFCVQTDHPQLIELFSKFEGKDIWDVYDDLASQLIPLSPVRVVESALGRMEVTTKIRKIDEKTPLKSHTTL